MWKSSLVSVATKCAGLKETLREISVLNASEKKNLKLEWTNPPTDPQDYVGFVYEIIEKTTGKRYFGVKKFWRKIKRKPLKGRKRKRVEVVESDWKVYNSSNKLLQEKIALVPEHYEKHILYLCKSVTEMKAREAHIQLSFYVDGRWDELYNEMISLRLRIRK